MSACVVRAGCLTVSACDNNVHMLSQAPFMTCVDWPCVAACRVLDVYGMMTQLPGVHPDSTLYRTIISTFQACGAPDMVLQVALIMAQQVGHL
jgi:hypothetical protein